MGAFLKFLGILSLAGGIIGALTIRGPIELLAAYVASGVVGCGMLGGLGVIIELLEKIAAAVAVKDNPISGEAAAE